LAFTLVILPIATATYVGVPVSNPMPAAPTEQVVDGVSSAVNTQQENVQSAAPSAQASPLPSPSLSNDPQIPQSLPMGQTNGDVDDGAGGDANIETRPTGSGAPVPSSTSSTSKTSTASLAKCATCAPNLRAPGAVAGLASGDAGSAADAAAQGEGAGAAQADVKDLTEGESGGVTPPAAVPGFGPLFALAGLGLLAWVRRRAVG
jgi:hypothetical protein